MTGLPAGCARACATVDGNRRTHMKRPRQGFAVLSVPLNDFCFFYMYVPIPGMPDRALMATGPGRVVRVKGRGALAEAGWLFLEF